jgi:hypothetical protein
MSSGRVHVLLLVPILSFAACAEPTDRVDRAPMPVAQASPVAIARRAFPRGAERPDARTLTHALPGRADRALVLGGGALAITPEDLASVEGAREGDAVEFREAAPDLDVVLVEARSYVEELRVLRSTRASTTARYAIRRGAEVARLRVDTARSVVEALDRDGFVRYATEPLVAVDARGERRALSAELEGDALTISLDARGLAYPIVVDPQWSATGAMKVGHRSPGAALLPDGRVLVAGGFTTISSDIFDAELLDAKSGAFAPASPLLAGAGVELVPTVGGRFLIGSGSGSQLFDAATLRWTATEYTQARNRQFDARVRLPDGRVLSVGGRDDVGAASAAAEAYDPKSNAWSRLPPMLHARNGCTATLLPGGKVLAAGGFGNDPDLPAPTAEIWDPAAGVWAATPPMLHSHAAHNAIALPDGRALLVGDNNNTGNTTVELFDPAKAAWIDAPGMTFPRARAMLVLVAGRVLVIGGRSSSAATATAEWFDPATLKWSPASSMATPREDAVAVPLADGRVVVIGGESGDGQPELATAEIFDPQLLATGASCTAGSGCTSGTCAQGICCATSCLGTCQSCAVPGHLGACSLDPSCGSLDAGVADAAADGSASPTIIGDFKSCARASDCASGHCVDGVCCDTACADRCHSCALPGSPGTCTAEPVGVDLRRECGGGLQCSGTCGPGGACIGSGAGVQCAPSRCVSSSTGVGPAQCTAVGAACPTDLAVPFDCGGYACEPALGACRTGCASSDECANGYTCDVAAKSCVASAAQPPSSSGGCVASGAARGGSAIAALGLGVALALLLRRRRPS